ncbi:hypothetical protein TW95_gp1082 [Pandoravirus inopinatum]|uniref:Uncharacterized protein n=1 Tax=Pandoravirus inopinatum TaxID=1605721 RepID=A0A0B5JA88_9VIRU|nr:hypothetical protein TW95_gp1082 [Pandoravirus inopinatum]AJF97816.1 hypothetical protein [Pandoravirus inopinatum]
MDGRETWASFSSLPPFMWGFLHRHALPADRDFRHRQYANVVRRPAVDRRPSPRCRGKSCAPEDPDRSFDDDARGLSLSALPREILDMITASIDHIRDLGAWFIATGLPAKGHHLRTIVRHGVGICSVLSAGAPLDLIKELAAAEPTGPLSDLVIPATIGGRVDVFDDVMRRWLHVVDTGYTRRGRGWGVHMGSMDDTVTNALVTAANLGHAQIINTIAYNYNTFGWTLPRGACNKAMEVAIARGHWASLASLSIACPADCIRSLVPWAILHDAPRAIKIVVLEMTSHERGSLFQCAMDTGAWRIAHWLASTDHTW